MKAHVPWLQGRDHVNKLGMQAQDLRDPFILERGRSSSLSDIMAVGGVVDVDRSTTLVVDGKRCANVGWRKESAPKLVFEWKI